MVGKYEMITPCGGTRFQGAFVDPEEADIGGIECCIVQKTAQ